MDGTYYNSNFLLPTTWSHTQISLTCGDVLSNHNHGNCRGQCNDGRQGNRSNAAALRNIAVCWENTSAPITMSDMNEYLTTKAHNQMTKPNTTTVDAHTLTATPELASCIQWKKSYISGSNKATKLPRCAEHHVQDIATDLGLTLTWYETTHLVDTASSAQQANSTSARPMHSSDVSSNVIAPTATSPQVAPSSPGISTSFSTSLPSHNLHGDASGDDGGEGQHIDWAINWAPTHWSGEASNDAKL